MRTTIFDGKLYEGKMGWRELGFLSVWSAFWRYKMDACELAAVEGLLE